MSSLLETIVEHWVAVFSSIIFGALSSIVVYRLVFHPLAQIPGPKIAAATWLYEIYYDLYLGGQFVFEIGRLHQVYVHVNDPELVDVVYPRSGKEDRQGPTAFLTIDHDLHGIRRGALNQYFSKTAVSKVEPYIRQTAENLCQRLESYARSDTPVAISAAYSSFTTDIITEYCFGKSYNLLDQDHFVPNLQAANDAMVAMLPALKQAPWLHKIMRLIPPSYMLKMNPGMSAWIAVENMLDLFRWTRKEKSEDRLFMEAVVLVNAATATTSGNISLATFYLLNQPSTFRKLHEELVSIASDSEIPSLAALEKLPYFNAIITETLRHSFGPVSRLPRIHTSDAVHLKSENYDYVVPPGFPLSMTSVHVHMNPELFPHPEAFQPERWLDEQGRRQKHLDKYLLTFSKGSRQCVGINLAYAEMYICIAAVTLRLGRRLELFETTYEKDVKLFRDGFGGRPQPDSNGIRCRPLKPLQLVLV
ncbi:cytochrome P450 [Tothia fuscella]|uniref:Cytochrome P450 n=1 Tax=Tothia fuscella TaxID=1048955 RepID=A0A9P4NKD1_9PEZI|nr:cytochrome P450 [Tothia fuscella]